jgi:hypothetical protein
MQDLTIALVVIASSVRKSALPLSCVQNAAAPQANKSWSNLTCFPLLPHSWDCGNPCAFGTHVGPQHLNRIWAAGCGWRAFDLVCIALAEIFTCGVIVVSFENGAVLGGLGGDEREGWCRDACWQCCLRARAASIRQLGALNCFRTGEGLGGIAKGVSITGPFDVYCTRAQVGNRVSSEELIPHEGTALLCAVPSPPNRVDATLSPFVS